MRSSTRRRYPCTRVCFRAVSWERWLLGFLLSAFSLFIVPVRRAGERASDAIGIRIEKTEQKLEQAGKALEL